MRRRLLTLEPGFSVERFLAATPLERESDRALYAEGLRLAGVCDNAAWPTTGVNDGEGVMGEEVGQQESPGSDPDQSGCQPQQGEASASVQSGRHAATGRSPLLRS